MLLSVTRVGATRQELDKAVAVFGADPAEVARRAAPWAHSTGRWTESADGAVRIQPVTAVPGLLAVRLSSWLGTRAAREQAFADLASAFARLAAAAEQLGGVALPTGIGLAAKPAVLGGDTHVLEVLSPVEQEVLCNLLRVRVPTLIAMTGRGVTAAGMPRDRIGSRWLMTSRSHLATRYLASTTTAHLDRVKAELRRRDGVARLDRMDVLPSQTADGTPVVAVRCIDAAASLATSRAHAIVLAALGLYARRLVRSGRRTGNARQSWLEENRAKAIADGLRARLAAEDQENRSRQPQAGAAPRAGSASQTGARGAPRAGAQHASLVGARDMVRRLLLELCTEFANLDVAVEELAPVLLPVELPRLGLRQVSSEGELFAWAARGGEPSLIRAARAGLADPAAGGQLLRQATKLAPGRVSAVLDLWRAKIADPPTAEDRGPDRDGSRGRRAGQRRPQAGQRTGQARQSGGQRTAGPTDRRSAGGTGHGHGYQDRGNGPPRGDGRPGSTT